MYQQNETEFNIMNVIMKMSASLNTTVGTKCLLTQGFVQNCVGIAHVYFMPMWEDQREKAAPFYKRVPNCNFLPIRAIWPPGLFLTLDITVVAAATVVVVAAAAV